MDRRMLFCYPIAKRFVMTAYLTTFPKFSSTTLKCSGASGTIGLDVSNQVH